MSPILTVLGFILVNAYVSWSYGGIQKGMTRAQVDRRLWAFASTKNTVYNGTPPRHTMVNYEFLRLGKGMLIMVLFDSSGKVCEVIPIFDVCN